MRKPFLLTRLLVVCMLQCVVVTAQAGVPVFEPPLPLESATPESGHSDWGTAAATDGSGNWVAVWSSTMPLDGAPGGDYDIHFARSSDGGLTFSARAALNADYLTDFDMWFDRVVGRWDRYPSLAADSTGTLLAVWQRSTLSSSGQIQMARSDDGGATWSPNALLADDGAAPSIATDGAGTWLIAWSDVGVGEKDIHFTRSTNDGATWSPPVTLNADALADTTDDFNPVVAWSGGIWVAAWTKGARFGDPGDRDVVSSRSIDGGATWSVAVAINESAANDVAWDQLPQLVSDGDGNWVAAWSSAPDEDFLRSDLLVARSSDGAATWSTTDTLNSDAGVNGVQHDSVKLAVASPDTYVATWRRYSPAAVAPYGSDADVMTSTSTDGGVTWSAMQPLNDATTDLASVSDLDPFIAHDPAGHWLAFWSSEDRRLASGTIGQGMHIAMALGDHPCGNGQSDPGEQCDTGRRGDLDCCGRVCSFDTGGTDCAADSELCTLERCDGAGTCDHLPAPAGTLCTQDTDLCTFDRCNAASTCEHVLEPRTNCKVPLAPGTSSIEMTSDGSPDGSSLRWDWLKGEATTLYEVVQELGAWRYALCAYDPTGLVARIDAPLYADCTNNGRPCWKTLGGKESGLRFSNREGIPGGMTRLKLKPGIDGRARASVSGRGPNLTLPALPLAGLPLTVQLVNHTTACWGATYSSTVSENTETEFSAKSD